MFFLLLFQAGRSMYFCMFLSVYSFPDAIFVIDLCQFLKRNVTFPEAAFFLMIRLLIVVVLCGWRL